MLPIDVLADLGKPLGYLVFFLIGAGFGFALEIAGFGDSRRLAAQFYLKDMTVLKTMFTGILVACLLIFLSSSIGVLDFSQLVVNETYLWPGIIGGLIMGVGFVIGGYCPGTSLVSAASLKIDGFVFLSGTVIGAGVFGETIKYFEDLWYSSYKGRYLVSDSLDWSIGATVLGVTILALVFFYAAEKTEEFFRKKETGEPWSWKITKRSYIFSSIVLVLTAIVILVIGQPDPIRKWKMMESKYSEQLTSKAVFIHPLEYVKTNNDASIKLITLDLRTASEFDAFHIFGAVNLKLDNLLDPKFVSQYAQLPTNGVVILIADKDEVSVKAWEYLKVQGVVNVYILENGLQNWTKLFGNLKVHGKPINLSSPPSDILELFPKNTYTPKIKVSCKKHGGGLCG